jgi:hypothetical protein
MRERWVTEFYLDSIRVSVSKNEDTGRKKPLGCMYRRSAEISILLGREAIDVGEVISSHSPG